METNWLKLRGFLITKNYVNWISGEIKLWKSMIPTETCHSGIYNTIDETFFNNEDPYKHLLACYFCTQHLRQPPEEVFTHGLQSVQTYFKDLALSKRVRHSRKR